LLVTESGEEGKGKRNVRSPWCFKRGKREMGKDSIPNFVNHNTEREGKKKGMRPGWPIAFSIM